MPKNSRGNVEVPPLAQALPAGTVHLQLPGVGGVCRRLGVDYAPALSGFEVQGGRSVPKIDGVVVCEVGWVGSGVRGGNGAWLACGGQGGKGEKGARREEVGA